MSLRQSFPQPVGMGRLKMMAMAILLGAAGLAAGGVVAPKPALAWWRGGVWVGPGYPYRPYWGWGRPYYYAPPPVVVAPPPVYYAPPPVMYAPPPPPVYYPPAAPTAVAATTCYTPANTCPMEVSRAPGTTCYCSDASGDRVYGTAR